MNAKLGQALRLTARWLCQAVAAFTQAAPMMPQAKVPNYQKLQALCECSDILVTGDRIMQSAGNPCLKAPANGSSNGASGITFEAIPHQPTPGTQMDPRATILLC